MSTRQARICLHLAKDNDDNLETLLEIRTLPFHPQASEGKEGVKSYSQECLSKNETDQQISL